MKPFRIYGRALLFRITQIQREKGLVEDELVRIYRSLLNFGPQRRVCGLTPSPAIPCSLISPLPTVTMLLLPRG